METRVRVPDSLQDDKSQFFLYTTENWLFYFPSDNQIFTPHPVPAKPCTFWDGAGNVGDSGYFRLAGACHEYSVASLNMKNFTSPTPRNCVRKALIFALNDSAEALVSLSSK